MSVAVFIESKMPLLARGLANNDKVDCIGFRMLLSHEVVFIPGGHDATNYRLLTHQLASTTANDYSVLEGSHYAQKPTFP